MSAKSLEDVDVFWSTEACGSQFVSEQAGTKEFYEAYRNFRYQTEWHIPLLVPFADARGKSVLEIGCGNGADGVMFALHGASYTGVDLTERAVEATRNHFRALGLSGTYRLENAEALSFSGECFDLVYAHGVLHHTEHPEKAVREVYRVLKPGGSAIIMLYHKGSFNYHVRIMGYMRLRVCLEILGNIRSLDADRLKLRDKTLRGVRGNRDPLVWRIHYENFLREGWDYLKAENFIHHCTDGPECPFAYAYSRKEVRELFSEFSEIRIKVAHFPLRKYWPGRWVPLAIEKLLASTLGWYMFVYAKK